MAITSAEKLKATNSKIAEHCRQLADENHEISSVLQRKGHAALFQLIAHLMLTIRNGTETFASGKALQDYVHNDETPSTELIDKVEYVLSVIKSIAVDNQLRGVFVKPGTISTKNAVKAIEFIMFGTFISLVERTRSIRNYSRDFAELRKYLIDVREGRAYLGKESFLESMNWVNERLEKENLVSAHVSIHTIPDDDYDELKEEDIVTIPTYHNNQHIQVPQVTVPEKTPTKRRRDDRNGIGIAVAKRGGKLPSGLSRGRAA